jgi:hypothetical protein
MHPPPTKKFKHYLERIINDPAFRGDLKQRETVRQKRWSSYGNFPLLSREKAALTDSVQRIAEFKKYNTGDHI